MINTIIELAGGLTLLIIEGIILVAVLELGCRLFFKIKGE